MDEVILVTSWTKYLPQTFTFTVENNVLGGSARDVFDYTIAVSDELVFGKLGTSSSNSVGEPDQKWGTFTTSLNGGQRYTIKVTVSYITNWGGANSVEIAVIDCDGIVVKSGHVIYCNKNTYKNFVSDYKYTLTITQAAKAGYETTVREEDEYPTDSIDSQMDDSTRSFTFTSSMSRTGGTTANSFTPTINPFVEGADNALTVVFTNTRDSVVAPTRVGSRSLPYAWILLVGLGLALFTTPIAGRRRKDED